MPYLSLSTVPRCLKQGRFTCCNAIKFMQWKSLFAAGLSVSSTLVVQAEKCGGGQDMQPDAKLRIGHTHDDSVTCEGERAHS